MRVIENGMGRTRFTAERYGWSTAALIAGALGMCAAALLGCDAPSELDSGRVEQAGCVGISCTDQSRIVYVLDYYIHIMHGDGSGDVNLQTMGRYPAISHDRTRIAYEGNDAKIWTMAVDGSDKQQITAGSTAESFPSFSPDDTKLVFMSAAYDSAGYGNEVYVTGSAPAAPTTVGHWKKLTSSGGTWLYSPRFTADGGRVGFQLGIYQDYYTPAARVAMVDATLSNQTQQYWQFLTTPTYGQGFVNTSDGSPDFSGDGTRIAYVDWNSNGAHIWRMAINGSNKVQLTSGTDEDRDPNWAAGNGIVFTSDRSYVVCGPIFCLTENGNHNARNLFTMDGNGNNVVRLTGTSSQVLDPSWQ